MAWKITVRFLGCTSVSTNISDCQVPNAIVPFKMGKVLSGGKAIERRWACAFDG